MATTKQKRPSSKLRHGISVIQSKTGGYDCIWKYYDDTWKRKWVRFHIISVNGEPADWIDSYQKYQIEGWRKPKYLDTTIILLRTQFNMLVDSGIYKVLEY